LIGSLLAAGLVFGLHVLLNHLGDPSNPNAVLTQMRMTAGRSSGPSCGRRRRVLIGSAGSAVAIRRFLDV